MDHDADGKPVKIYGVVQDVSAREDSRSRLEQITDELQHQQLSLLAEHRVAAQLQDIILPLPEEPFDLSGLRVLVRYLPAERTGRIGGDWYLATTDHRGGAVCAIGDVAGHGLAAATAMAQLRYGLSAWIATGLTDPGALMSNLNQLCLRLGITSTAIVTHFDAESGGLTWAQAGHPAPLLARGGLTVDLDRPAGMLLGTMATRRTTPPTSRCPRAICCCSTPTASSSTAARIPRNACNGCARRWPRSPPAATTNRWPGCSPCCSTPTRTTTPACSRCAD